MDNDAFKIYFNWSLNALMPVNSGAADEYMRQNREPIVSIAHTLLKMINYEPQPIFRGLLMKHPDLLEISPRNGYEYLSFTDDEKVAEHFSNINGFGAEYAGFLDTAKQLGTYGYVIEYTPKFSEVLFHYKLLDMLPYAVALTNVLGMDGKKEIKEIKKQREIMILQPKEPFSKIILKHNAYAHNTHKD